MITDGMKTSEFFLSVITAVLGVFIALGWLSPEESDLAVEWADQMFQAVGGLMTTLSVGFYSISRGNAKNGK